VPAVLEVLEPAAAEALEAAKWYRERSSVAAAAFEVEVRHAFSEIANTPDAWPSYLEGTRRFLLERFPYEIVYVVRDSRVLVVAIAHCKRRPAYWRDRTG
jgi:plasmid stabilization system protein ParE